jgi:hypothetical protein
MPKTNIQFIKLAPKALLAILLTGSIYAQSSDVDTLIAAANHGDAKSAFLLAQKYEKGDGICQSYDMAYSYYAKAMMQRQPYPGSMEAGQRAAQLMSDPNATYQLPHHVNDLTREIMAQAKNWRPDAQLMSLTVTPRGLERIRFEIESPSTHEGEWVMLTCASAYFSQQTAGRVNWGTWSLPLNFIDLDEALKDAARDGLKGRIDRAELTMEEGKGTHRPVWKVIPEGLGNEFLIDPFTGQRLLRKDINDPDPLYAQFEKSMAAARQTAPSAQQSPGQPPAFRSNLVCFNNPRRSIVLIENCFIPLHNVFDDPSRWHQKVPPQ